MSKKVFSLFFIVFLIWSTSSSLLAEILRTTDSRSVDSIFLTSIVVAISFLALQIITLPRKASRQALSGYSLKELSKLAIPALFGFFLYPILYFYGLSGTSPLKANVLNYLWPLIAFMTSFLLTKTWPNLLQSCAMLSATVGGYIVMVGGNSETWDMFYSRGELKPLIGAFLGALVYGVYTAIVDHLIPKNKNGVEMPKMICSYYMVLVAFLLHTIFCPIYFYFKSDACISSIMTIMHNRSVFYCVLFYALVNFTIAHILWYVINTSRDKYVTVYASLMAYLIPFASTVCLYFTLKKDFDITVSIGLILIVVSIFVIRKNDLTSVNITFISFIITLLLLVIFPKTVDESVIKSATFYLEVIIAIYSIIYGFLMNRVITDYKNSEDLLDKISINRLMLSDDERLLLKSYENNVMKNSYHEQLSLAMTDPQIKDLFIRHPNLLLNYLSIMRNKNQAVSTGEWFVMVILSISVIVLSFYLKDNTVLQTLMTLAICPTICLSIGALYEFTNKKTRLLEDFFKDQ